MKNLIVFYSFEGNTRLIAEAIAEEAGADILELKPEKVMKSRGFMKYFWGGKAAMMKEKPSLCPFDKNPMDYDFLFIGTPVWAFTYAPALKTFFSGYPVSGKKIALFCCHGGQKARTLEKMKAAVPGNEFVGEIDFRDPLKHNPDVCTEKARSWASRLIAAEDC